MQSERSIKNLKSVIDFVIDNRGRNPKSYAEDGIPVIDNYLITSEGKVDLANVKRFIDDEIYKSFLRKYIQADDVLMTLVGNGYGKVAIAPKNKCAIIQNTIGLRCNDNNNNTFLYYLLSNSRESFMNLNRGAAQPSIKVGDVLEIEFEFPPLPTQKKIAHILSTLDDKIELNRKMNQTLEEMAQTLFKSWFVDFDPVHAKAGCGSDAELEKAATELGMSKEILDLFPREFKESEMGMIPKGWKVSTIENEVTIYGGATPSTKEEKYWVDGSNHWATPRDLSRLNSKILIDTGRKITDDGVNKISSKQLPIGTVLLSSRAPVGYIAYSTVPISINQGFIAMVCNKSLSNYFIMYWLDIAMNEIKNRAIGTTFSEISKSAFRPIKLVVPSTEAIIGFDTIVAPMVKKIIENEYEIETLSQTRDALLPKLLSGELDV